MVAKKNILVLVESPAKARTLSRFLGSGYTLKATQGHLRDLPKSKLGVDVENDFSPQYVTPRKKSKILTDLKKSAKSADMLYLATDPDREGEAIAWHISEIPVFKSLPHRRVVFHEITEEAISKAFKSPRQINIDLVNAQQARRILDRLVGYNLSPLLWRKVRRGLSAGRVQSVAVRIIVDREREVEKFKADEYWILEAELQKKDGDSSPNFRAQLVGLVGKGKLGIKNAEEAAMVENQLNEAAFSVLKVKEKKTSRRPSPPFITSTLQQESWRRLRMSAKKTMVIAQQLYEGLPVGTEGTVGLITYMRTDSTRVSRKAITDAREFIESKYGKEYLPTHAHTYGQKVKGAQEAHEAIRPTGIMRLSAVLKKYLSAEQFKVYQLIWEKMIASQMALATFSNTTIDVEARHLSSKAKYMLRETSILNIFPGFIALSREGKDTEGNKKAVLPQLHEKDELNLKEVTKEQRFTQPPPRFTEASLIKELEQWGIGRPSTYAPIISTIIDREYVARETGNLKPTELGIVVNDLLVANFPNVVDLEFTAAMESGLDKVAEEKADWVKLIRDFYTPFSKDLAESAEKIEKVELTPEEVDETCPNCNKNLIVKTGRFGKFLACPGYPECKFTKSYQIKTGVKCPECDGDIVKRKSKKNKTFYGCGNYPDCQFATHMEPFPEPCPKCGSLMVKYRGKTKKCTKCDFKDNI